MTMRKHKVPRNFNRPFPWPKTPKQWIVLHDAFAKLLGLGAGVDAVMRKLTKRHDKDEAPVARELTEQDRARLERAATRRKDQQTTRARVYFRGVAKNPCLSRNHYKQTAQVARNLSVDRYTIAVFK